MNAADFFNECVDPTLDDFRQNHMSRRHAIAAVALVDMSMAYIHREEAREQNIEFDDSKFRNDLAGECYQVKIIRDLAKAQKHVKLTKHNPIVRFADDMEAQNRTYGAGRFGEGLYGGGFVVKVKEKGSDLPTEYSLLELLDQAIKFLKTRLQSLG